MNKIRCALSSDASSILDIYAPYIANTAVSFETEVPTVEDFTRRIMGNQESCPWLVYESGGFIAGYAYASKHRDRAAYQWSLESSVYVNESFRQQGIATKLYQKLFQILKYQGCRNLYAGITLPNEKSVIFHQKMGFSKIADYKNIGYKFNRWHTVGWYELQLNVYSDAPAPFIKWSQIESTDRDAIMNPIA
ncbi:N-acetyltransferase [Hanamia caeni]|uniref:N-acetyltransferase n=1 Tax=Hanamia caeni TaxID=2294116 RepID=A0A3M9NQV4_9BACT|nr:GNAT family N-acetyltransferase [Hanamia caeni]RNI40100.1 N-acetyltransferase [Hanamia caeni]